MKAQGFFVVSCFLFLCFFPAGCLISVSRPVGDQVCFREKCVNVEVVWKEEDVRRGLQQRPSLSSESGMLFVFTESRPHTFWMKDTLIPLDMVWMDEGQRIVHIEHRVPPCKADPCPRYTPQHHALYVLEVNAGYAEVLGLKLGDTAEFRLKEKN